MNCSATKICSSAQRLCLTGWLKELAEKSKSREVRLATTIDQSVSGYVLELLPDDDFPVSTGINMHLQLRLRVHIQTLKTQINNEKIEKRFNGSLLRAK